MLVYPGHSRGMTRRRRSVNPAEALPGVQRPRSDVRPRRESAAPRRYPVPNRRDLWRPVTSVATRQRPSPAPPRPGARHTLESGRREGSETMV